jgi:hypothetical protein
MHSGAQRFTMKWRCQVFFNELGNFNRLHDLPGPPIRVGRRSGCVCDHTDGEGRGTDARR